LLDRFAAIDRIIVGVFQDVFGAGEIAVAGLENTLHRVRLDDHLQLMIPAIARESMVSILRVLHVPG